MYGTSSILGKNIAIQQVGEFWFPTQMFQCTQVETCCKIKQFYISVNPWVKPISKHLRNLEAADEEEEEVDIITPEQFKQMFGFDPLPEWITPD